MREAQGEDGYDPRVCLEDRDIKREEQEYLHGEEVQWSVGGFALLRVLAAVRFDGRRMAGAARQGIRRTVREELDGPEGGPGASSLGARPHR